MKRVHDLKAVVAEEAAEVATAAVAVRAVGGVVRAVPVIEVVKGAADVPDNVWVVPVFSPRTLKFVPELSGNSAYEGYLTTGTAAGAIFLLFGGGEFIASFCTLFTK